MVSLFWNQCFSSELIGLFFLLILLYQIPIQKDSLPAMQKNMTSLMEETEPKVVISFVSEAQHNECFITG